MVDHAEQLPAIDRQQETGAQHPKHPPLVISTGYRAKSYSPLTTISSPLPIGSSPLVRNRWAARFDLPILEPMKRTLALFALGLLAFSLTPQMFGQSLGNAGTI